MLNTPDEHDEHDDQERQNKAGSRLRKTGPALFGFVIVILVIIVPFGYDSEELGALLAAAALYFARNAPATMKAKAKKFFADTAEHFYGCRTCQA
ncbi:hypothetical protein [Nocardiopsis sp. NPDC006832]|uniref:hypothetical protein n=1 Tax=Nocardiopsis sp. NPDC006832 TaxID=3157188 RepID=UPI0033C4467D